MQIRPVVRQKVGKEILKPFDYEKIINEMSGEALDFCIRNISPMLGFLYLKAADIRRIDLIERLMQIDNAIDKAEIQKYGTSPQYYCALMEMQMDRSLKCKTGSHAEEYFLRAKEALKKVRDGNGTLADIDDAFLVYTILCRLKINRDFRTGPVLADRPDYELYASDMDMFREMKKKNHLGNPGQEFNLQLFNILFLARGLDRRGGFDEVEKDV